MNHLDSQIASAFERIFPQPASQARWDEVLRRAEVRSGSVGLAQARRGWSVVVIALVSVLAVAIAAVATVVRPDRSGASPVREATPLAQTDIIRPLRRSIALMALRSGVYPATVVELGASGTGRQRHAVLAGTDSSGTTLLSFLDGFGMSVFLPGGRFADASTPMFVSDTVSGPSTSARIVGLVGIATDEVARVDVQLADGTTLTLPVDQAPGIAYEGFSYVSSSASSFPETVTAYDSHGDVVAHHKVDGKPLCSSSQPDCTG